jgi:peroxiredoxin Q/BCP
MSILAKIGLAEDGEPLQLGAPAPDAATFDEHGNAIRLADFYREGCTLIYFFPKADTPGCTKQACNLRDSLVELKARGVRVVGVSSDRAEAQLRFQQKHHLPFTLLADRDHAVARAFGVGMIIGHYARQSFLIRDRKIIWRDLNATPGTQAEDVLKVMATLPR